MILKLILIGLIVWFISWLFSFRLPRVISGSGIGWLLLWVALFLGIGWLIGIGTHIGMGGGI